MISFGAARPAAPYPSPRSPEGLGSKLKLSRRSQAEYPAAAAGFAATGQRAAPIPLTIFNTKGVPGNRRERIEAAVAAGGKHVAQPYEGWISTDPFRGGVRVIITGPHGFQREVYFAMDEDPVVISQMVRMTIED